RALAHREEVSGLRKYELIFVIRPDLEEEANEAVIEKFKSLIESLDGEILKLDKWGKRRLAYEVKDFREGFYVIIRFEAESKVTTELDRVMKISDDVLRHMIVREDE
ncbi:MAG: 30S ribosomal protein S6, partial [Pelotomaculum thermopropionicum]